MKVIAAHTWNLGNGSLLQEATEVAPAVIHATVNRPAQMPGRIVIICVALVIGMGCATTMGTTETRSPVDAATVSAVETNLLSAMDPWRSTPHRLGGNLPSGADCSGFVVALFRDEFGVQLPRTTREQANVGEPVRRSNLATGDLVFFAPGRQVNHVGVYLSGGRFAHISTSSGFVISHLDEPYWSRRYHGARRVLDVHRVAQNDPVPIPAIRPSERPAAPAAPSTLPSGRRGGW